MHMENSNKLVILETARHREVMVAIRKLMHTIDSHSRKLLKRYDITVPQVMCLYELEDSGTATIASLTKAIHLSASTMVGIIDRLEEKGMVSRHRDMEDKRMVAIDITDKGREFLRDTPDLLHNRLAEQLSELSEAQQEHIATSLATLVRLADAEHK